MKRSDIEDDQALRYAYDFHHGPPGSPAVGQALVDDGFPPKVVWAKLSHLVDRGLLDYGVSLNTAWPTPEGESLLVSSIL